MHQDLSPAMAAVRSPDGRLTLGLMTPPPQPQGSMADPAEARKLAQLAEAQGIAALWTRDVPLAIPQGQDRLASSLDEVVGMSRAEREAMAMAAENSAPVLSWLVRAMASARRAWRPPCRSWYWPQTSPAVPTASAS